MKQGRRSQSAVDWSHLPDDLLASIRSRVVSSRGRIRFAAVCRSWRAAASHHVGTPALPLLVLSLHDDDWGIRKKHLYCPDEGRVLRVPVPSKLHDTRFCGTYNGGWIAAIAPMATLTIVNLFSGIEVALSGKQKSVAWNGDSGQPMLIWKLIFSELPTSSGCILAALIANHNKVALCRLGCPDGGWTIHRYGGEEFSDVVFHRGELYGVTYYSNKLFKFDIAVNQDGASVVTAAHPLDVQWRDGPKTGNWFSTYIFELNGKLSMAMMMTPWLENHKASFQVFQLTVTVEDEHKYEWTEVHTLGDCTLFLGRICSSQVVHLQSGGSGVVKKNHIYYSNYRPKENNTKYEEFNEDVDLARSEHGDHIYYKHDPKPDGHRSCKEEIPSTGYYNTSYSDFPMWCFPPDF